MIHPEIRMASDYNHGLAWPVRWAHIGIAACRVAARPVTGWAWANKRRAWAAPLLLGLIATLLVMKLDAPIVESLGSVRLGGDVRRELHAWQQFGALTSLLVVAAIVWRLDPRSRQSLIGLGLAQLIAVGACNLLKIGLGRARPFLGDPGMFVGLWGAYPLPDDEGGYKLVNSFEGGADLWSMPSSHTAAAVVLACYLARRYPRIRTLAWALACVVAAGRLLLGAHWPSDIVGGWTIGLMAAGIGLPVGEASASTGRGKGPKGRRAEEHKDEQTTAGDVPAPSAALAPEQADGARAGAATETRGAPG